MCRPGRGWRSPRSSPTCSPGASSAGAPPRPCRPNCRSMPWRWRCGPVIGPARPWTGWCTTATPAPRQYTAIRYAARLLDAGAVASIGSVGDSYDCETALAESVIGLYKTECVRHEGPWRGVDHLELATLNWVHWFNEHRLHSSIGNVPPLEYETEYYRHNPTARQPPAGEPSLH